MDKKLETYVKMGQLFARRGNFMSVEAQVFTGLEVNTKIALFMYRLLINRLIRKNFERFARQWGCTRPLDDKPYA